MTAALAGCSGGDGSDGGDAGGDDHDDAPGTDDHVCTLHPPGMLGRVIVG